MQVGLPVTIRAECAEDGLAVSRVNTAAFGGNDEGSLVEALHGGRFVLLSLVAELDGEIVGHVLFSRMAIETPTRAVAAVALAPVAVLPAVQRQGIGSLLIRTGLDLLRTRGEDIVIVVGHAGYYPRFGFSTEKASAIESPFPRGVFMALELRPGSLAAVEGRVRYPPPFGI
jgi:putative acetyltransferase